MVKVPLKIKKIVRMIRKAWSLKQLSGFGNRLSISRGQGLNKNFSKVLGLIRKHRLHFGWRAKAAVNSLRTDLIVKDSVKSTLQYCSSTIVYSNLEEITDPHQLHPF